MTFKSFNSLEEMQTFIQQQGDAAQTAMTKEQRALTWGSYAMLPTSDFIIFGYVFTEEELRLGETAAGASEEELEYSLRTTQASLERGYLFGRWYSLVEPEGELGSNHAVGCWPISPEQFNIASTFGWDGKQIVQAEEGDWLLDKYVALAQSRHGS